MPKRVGVKIIMWLKIYNIVHKKLILVNSVIEHDARYVRNQDLTKSDKEHR